MIFIKKKWLHGTNTFEVGDVITATSSIEPKKTILQAYHGKGVIFVFFLMTGG